VSFPGREVARRPHPSTVAERDWLTALLAWACSVLWGFRFEVVLLAAAAAGFVALVDSGRLMAASAGALEGALLAVGLSIPQSRRGLFRVLSAARVRRRWRRAWLHCGLPPARARRVERVPAGDRVRVRVSRGSSFLDLEERREELAACLRLRDVRIDRDPADASRGSVTLVRRDPLADLGGLPWPLAEASEWSLWEAFPLGLGEDGQTVCLRLPERNVLLGGEPGGGKSAALSIMLAASALDSSTRLWLLDGKLVELAAWSPLAERTVGPDVGEAIELLEAVQRVMDDRYRDLLASGRRKIEPIPELPLHVVACDELALYLLAEDRKERARFAELLRDLVARGRAAGVIVLAATQKPAADVVPSALRDLFGFRLAFRCTTPQASDTILGQGWASQGYSAATIRPADRGVGFLLADDGLPVRLQTFYLDDQAIGELASRAVYLRGDWVL
jgi:hypothetical protein